MEIKCERASGRRRNRSWCLTEVGREALLEAANNRFRVARMKADRALAHWQTLGHQRWIAKAFRTKGEVELMAGNRQHACVHLQKALDLYEEVGDRMGAKKSLTGLQQASRVIQP